jgi:glucose/arabinose dehydrogenase
MTQQNQKLQGVSLQTASGQSSSQVNTKLITTSQSSGNTQSVASSITIAEGSADQQVKVYYQPNPAHISSGSTVMWINKDTAPHTATSGLPSSAKDSGKIFDTGLIEPGSTGSALITGNGNTPYYCTFHPWMTGTIQITASNQTSASSLTLQQNKTSTAISKNQTTTLPAVAAAAAPIVHDPTLRVVQVTSGLTMPTSMAFLGPDDFLVLQKDGTVTRVTNGTISSHPLLNVTVGKGFTQGMLGITISKNSKLNSTYVFLYYTESLKSQTSGQSQIDASTSLENRLYRYELVNGKLINPKLLVRLPAGTVKQDYMDNGGYLRIGSDNNVYFSVGAVTGNNVSAVQTLTQNFVNGTAVDGRAGILRITQDGKPVLDKQGHGLLGDSYPLNLYYGYGIKDNFGIDFDPITGHLWDAEPGRIINDEINLIEPRFNGGFEALQGPSIIVPAAPANLVSFNGTGKYRDPEFTWIQKVVPTGLKFLTSNKLGDKYENDIFLGSFLNGKIYHFDLNKNRNHLIVPTPFMNNYNQMPTWNSTGAEDITFGDGFGGISSLNVGPDSYLYVISLTKGIIYKIIPSQSNDQSDITRQR